MRLNAIRAAHSMNFFVMSRNSEQMVYANEFTRMYAHLNFMTSVLAAAKGYLYK